MGKLETSESIKVAPVPAPAQPGKRPKVVVQYSDRNLGPWHLNYAGRGSIVVHPGDKTSFDPHDALELNALIQVIKIINAPRRNQVLEIKKDGQGKRYEYYSKFKLESGQELIPPVILAMKYRENLILTDDEEAAILAVCPSYQFQKKTRAASPMG